MGLNSAFKGLKLHAPDILAPVRGQGLARLVETPERSWGHWNFS